MTRLPLSIIMLNIIAPRYVCGSKVIATTSTFVFTVGNTKDKISKMEEDL